MIYLDTKMCGYDEFVIGFPSVMTCMAIVVETEKALIGWHASSGTDTFNGGAVKFGKYFERKRRGYQALRVYGVSHENRFGGNPKQEIVSQLRSVAAEVGAKEGRFAVLPGGLAELVEFRRGGTGHLCDIFYAPNTDVTYNSKAVSPSATKHRTIHPTQGDTPQRLFGGDDDSTPIVESVSLVKDTQGLHRLPVADVKKFTL